jgi:hypothetical protein
VEDSVSVGRCPELVGGGLIRSLGGWIEVVSMRRHGKREMSNERILGNGDFVRRILEEAEEKQKHQFSAHDRQRKIDELIVKTCEEENINPLELQSGSRRRSVSKAGSTLARQLVNGHGGKSIGGIHFGDQ